MSGIELSGVSLCIDGFTEERARKPTSRNSFVSRRLFCGGEVLSARRYSCALVAGDFCRIHAAAAKAAPGDVLQ